ncbi:MAG: putative transporter [Solirubrobacterales bacterium]|nr:putative transporter [Solirubrobacterales bacterium]
MTKRLQRPSLNYLLGALCVAAIVAAYTSVGAASSSTGPTRRFVGAEQGVVQSTVSGSGNLQVPNQLNLGFKTSGVVTHIYVAQGQHVNAGQLLAALDPQSAQVALEQAKATLQSAEATLSQEEESEGETTSGSAKSTAAATTASVSYVAPVATAADTSGNATVSTPSTPAAPQTKTAATTPSTSAAPTTKTTPTATTPATKPTSTPTATTPSQATGSGNASEPEKAKQSAATREANLASARAAVKSDRLAVQGDEKAVQNTRLYAPESGTIAALSGEVGETVSATGTTKASSSSSASSSGGGSSASSPAGSTAAGPAASSSSGSSSSSSSSSFAVLSDLGSMELVVPLSESEVGNVKVGQTATVTVEALSGRKLVGHVTKVATLPTSNSGVVSYDVTFELDQTTAGLKPGMSAATSVVVSEASGISVPTSAISGATVTVHRGGSDVRQSVVTGLAGDSSTIILSGIKVGEEVALPVTSATGAASGQGAKGRTGSGFAGRGGFPGGGLTGGGPPGGG